MGQPAHEGQGIGRIGDRPGQSAGIPLDPARAEQRAQPSVDDEDSSGDITGLFAESRQQATALKGIVAEIRQVQKASAGASPTPGKKAGGSGVADLSARIAARKRKAQG